MQFPDFKAACRKGKNEAPDPKGENEAPGLKGEDEAPDPKGGNEIWFRLFYNANTNISLSACAFGIL